MEPIANLQSWQQAFEDYPISTTRAIEKQLRANISNNKEKLRAVVGSNYRELLSTAEQIISLDIQTKDAESHISSLSQRCQPPVYSARSRSTSTKASRVAQLRLLHRCLCEAQSALAKLDLLLCAKLMVIGRLLLKSLSEPEPILKSLGPCRSKLASIRRRLLRTVDIFMSRPSSTVQKMLEAGCAYCLITSASSQDMFKHIQHLRLERLRLSLETEELSRAQFVDALRYQLSSLQSLKSVSGRWFEDALQKLQRRPILEDSVLIENELLGLSETIGLIPEEISSFTPYLKRKPSTSEELDSLLEKWSISASQIFAPALEDGIPTSWTVSEILELRRQLYSHLLPVYFSIPARSTLSDALAHAMLTHLGQQCFKLTEQLTKSFEDLVESCNDFDPPGSLWQAEMVSMTLNSGAAKLLGQVHYRRAGTSKGLADAIRSIKKWIKNVETTREQYEALRKTRWREMLEEPEVEQEEEAAEVLAYLTKHSPDAYVGDLQECIKDGFDQAQDIMLKACSQCLEQEDGAGMAVALIRATRESMHPLRQTFKEEAKFEELNEMIPQLHEVMAKKTWENTLAALQTVDHDSNSITTEHMPSPKVFQTLQQLCQEMIALGGTDVWSPPAVGVVKRFVSKHIFDEQYKSDYVLNTFDKAYLAAALNHPSDGLVADGEVSQSKAGREYWIRTKLLFGVLG